MALRESKSMEELHEVRIKHYEETKNMTYEEKVNFYKEKTERLYKGFRGTRKKAS